MPGWFSEQARGSIVQFRMYTPGTRSSVLAGVFCLTLTVSTAVSGLELENVQGGKEDIGNYIGQGRWVVMNVWSPSCTFCVQELPHILEFHRKHSDQIDVIGITVDYPSFAYGKRDLVNRFLQHYPIDSPLFLADHAMASEVIGGYLKAIPLLVIFHPDGRILGRWPGEVNIPELEEFIRNYERYGTEDWGLGS